MILTKPAEAAHTDRYVATFILSSFSKKGPQAAVAAAILSETLVLSLTHEERNKKKVAHPTICLMYKWPATRRTLLISGLRHSRVFESVYSIGSS